MVLKCKNCRSTAIRKTASGKYLCSICLHVTKENNVYTDEFKKIKFTKQIKMDTSNLLQGSKRNRNNEKLNKYLQSKKKFSKKFFLENWTTYLFTLQEELRLISKALAKYYGNNVIKKIMRAVWFDVVSSSKKNQTMISLKFTTKSTLITRSGSKFTPIKRIESNILRDLENANSKFSTKKINYDLIFGKNFMRQPKLSNFSSQKKILKSEKKNSNEENSIFYKYNSRRFLRSKKRKRVEKHPPKFIRRRRKSSNIKLIQDDETITMFKDFEDNLLNCKGKEDFFGKILLLIQQKCEAVQMAYLIKRYVETYVYGNEKMLNKKERVNLKLELKRVIKFINKLLEIDQPKKITLLEYNSLRKNFHFFCFILGLMKYVCDKCNEKFKEAVGLKNTFYPFQTLDIEIFIEKLRWEKLKNDLKISLKKVKEFCERNEELKNEKKKKNWSQTIGSTACTTLNIGNSINVSNSIFGSFNHGNIFKSEFGKNEKKNKFFADFEKEELEISDCINYEKLYAIIRVSLALSCTAFTFKELEMLIKNLKKEKFNTKINHNFSNRRNYLFYNLRYFKRLKPKTLWKDFKLIYPNEEDWENSKLINLQEKFNFEINLKNKIVFVKNFNLRILKKSLVDFGLCSNLRPIALWLGEFLQKNIDSDEKKNLEKKNENLSIGVIFFCLKLFYGVGIGVPSMVNLKEAMIAKYVNDKDLKSKTLKCLSYISSSSSNIKKNQEENLIGFSRKINSFQSLVEKWMYDYESWHESQKIFSTFSEISHLNLENFRDFVKKNLNEILKQKCKIDPQDSTLIDLHHNEVRGEKNPRYYNGKKIEISVKRKLVDPELIEKNQKLREELNEEVEFINKNFGSEKEIEIPHPSDIFIKFKMFGSIPFERVGEDYLILVKFANFYFDLEEEKIIQVAQRFERMILKALKKKDMFQNPGISK